jgi:Penicillin-binding Protein dimerisation domain/PASTA domain
MARKSRLKTKASKRRWSIFVFLFFLLASVGTGVWYNYQQQLTNLAEVWQETFDVQEEVTTDELRGTIFDRNFKELAQTLERVSLYVRPREVTNLHQTAEQLSGILGIPESEILESLERDSHLVWLRRDIAQVDEELVANLNLPGIYFHREFARSYPEQEKASHLIGYSENDRGLAGIEHYYNRLLNHGSVRQTDLPDIDLEGLDQTLPYGHDLVLTLDMKIQTILENYVTSLGQEMGEGQIASLLLNAVDGKIIAGANYPSYNLNSVWKHEHEVLNSLLITPVVIPEEIRKFFRIASQLQGGWEQGTQVYPWSVVSGKMGFARQIRLWDRLQLSTELHVDFSGGKKRQAAIPQFVSCVAGEDCGAVPITATPLKVLLGMTHLLNGGSKVQPHILDRILERSSQKEYFYNGFLREAEGRKVLPSLVSKELRTLLQTAGKKAVLGTAILSGETVSLIPDYSGGQYVRDRMSVVVVPGVKPELMLLLVSRQNKPGPDAQKVLNEDFLIRRLDSILPSMVALQQVNQNIADMMEFPEYQEKNFNKEQSTEQNSSGTLASILEKHTLLMPDLTGFSLRKGLRLLERTEITVQVNGTGRIVGQIPAPGEELKKDAIVQLELATDLFPENGMQDGALQE